MISLLVRNSPNLGTATITLLGRGTRLLLRTYEARNNNNDQNEALRLARLYARMFVEVISSTGAAVTITEEDTGVA